MLDKGFVHCCPDPSKCALSSGGGRKLATHPHNIWRTLHDEQRRGEIEHDELHRMLDRMHGNVEEYNCAAREINKVGGVVGWWGGGLVKWWGGGAVGRWGSGVVTRFH